MRTSARLRIAASYLVIAIAAACGSDSTGPSQSPASVALHFDSLYVEANDLSDSIDAFTGRAILMSLLEVPPAFGASPSTISVTTANGVEHWKAFEFLELLSPTDSGFALLAYREQAAHTALLIQFHGDGTVSAGAMITNDTLSVSITGGSASTSLTSTGATCGTPSASLVNPQVSSIEFSSCTLANFLTSLSITTETSSLIDPALASIDVSASSVNGIRLVDVSDAATVRRVRALLDAARASKRL